MYQDKPDLDELISNFYISDELLESIIKHDGTPHEGDIPHSGRYPYGSGEKPYQSYHDFVSRINELKAIPGYSYTDAKGEFGPAGKTYTGEVAIAHTFGLTSTQYRVQLQRAKHEARDDLYIRAKRLHDAGKGYSYIARELGLPNESSARSLLNTATKVNKDRAMNTANFLKEQIEEKGMIEVGSGTESNLGISKEKLKEALYILEQEGYMVAGGRIQNVTDPSGAHQTTLTVVGPKNMEKKDIYRYENINFMSQEDYNKFREENGIESLDNYISRDDGQTFEKKFVFPESMDSSRLMIRYAEDGGTKKDGIIEIRRGVDDLSLGESTYAQVRILVDNDHYLKGMALYSDNIPEGYDVVFNTNKSNSTPMMKVLKEIKSDPDNPFGSNLREEGGQYWYTDSNGNRKLGLINKTRQEGDWNEWQDKVPSQFLSKQSLQLAERQLNLAIEDKKQEYNDILALENNTIKKYELEQFANDCDSAAVHLQAAALPRQKHQVILPIDSMKDDEVYAPNYENGEKVALVRYPHGGTFEIPILTVNNKQPEAVALLKGNTKDCVGINSKVAARLSGADFDGDTVMVIPTNDRIKITSKEPLEGLINYKGNGPFDPKAEYGTKEVIDKNGKSHYINKFGNEIQVMANTNTQMGIISNLITDMTIQDATDDELSRAVRHSMVVIDAEKHKLDYKTSYKENRIDDLKRKYQNNGINPETGKELHGSSTLISKAKSQELIPKTEGQGHTNIPGKPWYDPSRPEGALIFKTAGPKKLYYTQIKNPETGKWVDAINKNGKLMYNNSKDPKVKNYISAPDDVPTREVMRTTKSTQMEQTDDARTLISEYNSPMENLYANYANTMKAFANQARKEAYETIDIRKNPTAAKTYANEVASLKRKIDISEKNPPRERQAQVLATVRIKAKKQAAIPELTKEQIKKLSDRELKKARQEVGASRQPIDITDKEWEAIQAGAISAQQLKKIMNYADKDKLKERATPRSKKEVTPMMQNRIESLSKAGKTNSEIAAQLGLSASTVSKYSKKS